MNPGKLSTGLIALLLLAAATGCRDQGANTGGQPVTGQGKSHNKPAYASSMTLDERIKDMQDPTDGSLPRLASAGFKGRGDCFSCHKELVVGYRQTAHDLANNAMEPMFVHGDFNDVEFADELGSARFFRNGEKYMVHTAAPGQAAQDYVVKWAIGGQSVQQYALDTGNGRLQVLDIGWDAREAADGGQRWFRLPAASPHEMSGGRDWLGWNANWNTNCIRCHAGGTRIGYLAESRGFETYLPEDDVGCESCHGGAKFHIGWAEGQRQGLENKVARKGLIFFLTGKEHEWKMDKASGTAYREPRRTERREVETCMQCHALQQPLVDEFGYDRDPLNYVDIALLREGLYEADGQPSEVQVYEAGSFLQSREYMYGVSCSDCHDPHTGRTWEAGNELCLRCHSADKFDNEKHSFHPAGSEGASCVACHMPVREYLGADLRHDHSIRIPRPDLTQQIGTPNACSQCHDMGLDEIVSAWQGWYGTEHAPHFGTVFAAARSGDRASIAGLSELATDHDQAPIVRATALEELGSFADEGGLDAIRGGLVSDESIIRLAAVRALEHYPMEKRRELLLPHMEDELQTVQMEIGRLLAGMDMQSLDAEQLRKYNGCVDKYVVSLQSRPWLAIGHARLAELYSKLGMEEQAKAALAEMHACEDVDAQCCLLESAALRRLGDNDAADRVLRDGIALFPDDEGLQRAIAEFDAARAGIE
ncbi:hypothetical protein KDL29_12560 [bacterium]|nr:hypothetical protein [bacterium]